MELFNTVCKTNIDLVKRLKFIATDYKTLYVMGCFGAPLTKKNKERYCTNHSYNKSSDRQRMIQSASEDTFGFDCGCLIKGVLWGWNGDISKTYGGASYTSNNVPDLSADQMIQVCNNVSTDFSKIEVGEAVWVKGHIGVYIGNGLAVECTPKWNNNVQITACNQSVTGYNRRDWTKHGKLPYIEYVDENDIEPVYTSGKPSTGSESDAKVMWDFLMNALQNEYAVAGILGNIYAESLIKSNNLQQSCQLKLGYTDETYTQAVDNRTYDNFVRDSAGYGLAQWTYWSRKAMLLEYANESKKSIGDFDMQLNFLCYELETNFKSLVKKLKECTTVREASDLILHKFEQPADQSEATEIKRAEYSQRYYEKFHSVIEEPNVEIIPTPEPIPDPQPEIITSEDKNILMKLIEAVIDFIIGLFKKSR